MKFNHTNTMKNDNKPEAPEGYTVMLGKDVPRPVPEGTKFLVGVEWRKSISIGQVTLCGHDLSWYAVPNVKEDDQRPKAPEGYAVMLGKDVPRNAPADGLMVWYREVWLPTEYSAQSCYPNLHNPLWWFAVPTKAIPTDPKASQSIAEEAAAVVAGDRAADYGDVNESFARIAKLWSAYTGSNISPWDVAQMMILLKVSRAKTSAKRDTLVDIIGYAECANQLKHGTLVDNRPPKGHDT